MIIVLMGKPGSGKDEQARLLSEKYGLPHITTGELIREEMKINADLRVRMERGDLASMQEINVLFNKRLEQVDVGGGYILNGIPRTLEQAKFYENSILKDAKCIILEVSDEIAISRIAKRSLVSGRIEDSELGIVQNRMNVYRDETQPAVEYIKTNFQPGIIDATKSIEEVFAEIEKRLNLSIN
jgi:adenylate kinase